MDTFGRLRQNPKLCDHFSFSERFRYKQQYTYVNKYTEIDRPVPIRRDCHKGMPRPRVAGGEYSFQIWWVAVNQ